MEQNKFTRQKRDSTCMRNKLCCDFERKNSLEIKSTWLKYQLHVELLMTQDSSTLGCRKAPNDRAGPRLLQPTVFGTRRRNKDRKCICA